MECIEINVYGRTFNSVHEFCLFYRADEFKYYQILSKQNANRCDRFKKAALQLIDFTLNNSMKSECIVYGEKFLSVKDCCIKYNINESTIKKMMKYNPNLEYCMDRVLGANKKKYLRQNEIEKLLNRFIYGNDFFTNIGLQN